MVTGPRMIYLDEILVNSVCPTTAEIGDPNRPGALVCRSEDRAVVSWYITTERDMILSAESTQSSDFRQITTPPGQIPSISRLYMTREGVYRTDALTNGLFRCRDVSQEIHVGLYSRGNGKEIT